MAVLASRQRRSGALPLPCTLLVPLGLPPSTLSANAEHSDSHIPSSLPLHRLLAQQTQRVVTASVQGDLDAPAVLVAMASVAGDLGGRASMLGEFQPAVEETDQARAARSLARSLMRAVGQSKGLEACGWAEIREVLLPPLESVPLPELPLHVAMWLLVGDGDAQPRELQQVWAPA